MFIITNIYLVFHPRKYKPSKTCVAGPPQKNAAEGPSLGPLAGNAISPEEEISRLASLARNDKGKERAHQFCVRLPCRKESGTLLGPLMEPERVSANRRTWLCAVAAFVAGTILDLWQRIFIFA